jgi:hypothetical protein
MNRSEWLEELKPLLCHPSMKGVGLDTFYQKTFDFNNDLRIPAVLVCLLADVQFHIWNGEIVNKGLSLLMVRRGFEVGALQGVWSMVAGVREILSSKECISAETLTILGALKEIGEETGIPVSMIEDEVVSIGSFLQTNPQKREQGFVNEIVCANVKSGITPAIQLCHEHTGAVWVPLESIREYYNNPQCLQDKERKKDFVVLKHIIKDGMAENTQEKIFKALIAHLYKE